MDSSQRGRFHHGLSHVFSGCRAGRSTWRYRLGAVAALTLGLSTLALFLLAWWLRGLPRPEGPTAQDELTAITPSGPAESGQGVEFRRQAVNRLSAELLPAPKTQPPPEILPAPRPLVVRIVLGPAEGPELNRSFHRRNRATEEELRLQLASAEEAGLGSAGASVFGQYVNLLRTNENASGGKGVADCSALLALRPDLATLRLRDGPGSILPRKAASELNTLSRKLRVYLNIIAPPGPNGRPMEVLRERLRKDLRGKKPEWLRAEAVPTLTQMLMAEDASTRRLLVDLLAAIPQKPATLALARRAVFDLDAEVRAAATAALKGRDPEVWRPVLLDAFRYPWAPPADFAAEALVHLKDKGAVPELVAMLREPRPGRPVVLPDRRVVIREVVKINHLNNCQLCHPPALSGKEPVLGTDPVQSIPQRVATRDPTLIRAVQALSPPSTGGHDYGNRIGTGCTLVTVGRGRSRTTVALVTVGVPVPIRGDITFLRQDFSVGFPQASPVQRLPQLQRIAQNNPVLERAIRTPPPPVRFDYVVRTRPVQKGERKKWQALKEKANPQRDALLFALRELTSKNPGDRTEDWDRAFPLAVAQARSVKLVDRLLQAEPLTRAVLLQRYVDGQGVEHDLALERAVGRLTGPEQETARRALVNLLARKPASELRARLSHHDVEVRRAAVCACVRKNDPSLTVDLVALIDADPATAELAREALKKLTGQELSDTGFLRGDD
jgi:hypothetical protein